ncbi:maltoporin [Parachitinimonas caeni]|uniref:Carbohydrate porin n=1 Tax=Parachitinimonas caeni TaxID=3031301 RepID=A0ABT7DV52_9NEIS|nr:carbohydrate porin [Parachitinimonas caeni]MDK2123948.1 carbohydrate porin [Parachitinimonas caeni]
MSRKFKLLLPVAAITAAFAAQSALAVTPEFHGYLRSGSGSNSQGGKEACFRIGTPAFGGVTGGSGRLGNECDTYGELAFDAGLGDNNGINFKLHTMVAFGTQQQGDWEQNTPSWRQAWVEASNVGSGALANATLWAGKRYYKRRDVHITDFFWLANTGPGAGIENIDLGFGKLSYALIRTGDQDWDQKGTDSYRPQVAKDGKKSISGHDFRLEGINANPGGTLDFGFNYIAKNTADGVSGKNGWGMTAVHNQNDMFGLGGFNNVVFQYAKDAANLDGSGKWWADSSLKYTGWRLFDHWVFEPKNSNWNGALFVGYGREKYGDAGYDRTFSVVARPIYHFTDAYSLAVEAGTTRVSPNKGDSYYLNKLTIAPQLAVGKGFWARPVLRAYATFASWDKAAGNPVCTGRDCGVGMSAFAGKTSGASYGVQMEAWW